MISAFLSDFDRLTPEQRSLVDRWIIDDPDQLPKPSAQDDLVWDHEHEDTNR